MCSWYSIWSDNLMATNYKSAHAHKPSLINPWHDAVIMLNKYDDVQKYPYIYTALYHDSSLKSPSMARVNQGSQFYLLSTRLSTSGMNHTSFTPQPRSITALWLVLISGLTEGRRLSWPRSTWCSNHPKRILWHVQKYPYIYTALYHDSSEVLRYGTC